ncbi:MAG: hypothetical protein ABFR19_03095 [Pseudomonadota bacterium]
MRLLLYLLVTLNLLLFLWIYQKGQQIDQQQAGRPLIGDLQIVSEEHAQQLKEERRIAADADQQAVENEPQTVSEETIPQGVAEQKPADAEEQLPSAPAQQPESQQAAAAPVPARQCTTLGPVTTYLQAKLLTLQLARFGLESMISSELVASITGYEVILPPLESDQAVTKMLQKLQQAGIGNIDEIRVGEYRKGISFGLYHFRDDAERRLFGVAHFTENAVIVERKDLTELFSVEMDSQLEESLAKEQIERIRTRYIGVEIQSSPCQ